MSHPNQQPEDQSKKKMWLIGGIAVAVIAVFAIRGAMLSGGAVNGTIADPVIGPENAVMVIREYSDLQCPACRSAQSPLHAFVEAHPADVRLEFNDFPLSTHKNARVAAYAANCANEQGKFWEFAEVLFDKQSDWENLANPVNKYKEYFATLGGDAEKLGSCTNDRTYRDAVEEDIKEGSKAGINSTPTFFVNGERIVGGLSLQDWEAMLTALKPSTSTGPIKSE